MEPKVREGESFVDDNSAKKKFKFKSFKKLFGKKKRKEPLPSISSSGLKQSQSASDVTVPDTLRADYDSEEELEATAGVLGSRAVSHDSIFIPEIAQETARPIRVFSQENVSDHIKALQMKLQANIKVGPPPIGFLSKRSDDAGTSSEDDGLPRSPPEMSLIHEAVKTRFSNIHRHHHSALSLAGTGSEEDEQISSETSSRPLSPDENELRESHKKDHEKRDSTNLSPSVDFSTPPQYSTFLDNSAARHRLSVKPRNQRLSTSRRPSVAVQEESYENNLTFMDEEDVLTPDPKLPACGSMKINTPDTTDNTLDLSLKHKVSSSRSAEVNESQNLPEVEQNRSLDLDPQSENVISGSDHANFELDPRKEDQIELVCGTSSDHVSTSLPTVEKEIYAAISAKNRKHLVKESSASVDIKLSAVEKTVVHSLRTTSPGLSQESLYSRRSHFENSLHEKPMNYQDQPLSDKENNKQLDNGDKKLEKSHMEATQRKFSVSSAWERPRTGSFSLKANVENEAHKNTKLSLLKPGMSKTEIMKEESKVVATNSENKSASKKNESLSDPEGTPADRAVFSNITPSQRTVQAANELPVVTESQPGSEEKKTYPVKLRSTSLSSRYGDGMNPSLSMIKTHSAEFKQAKSTDLSFFKEELDPEKAENKDIDVFSSKSENEKCVSESAEGTQAKPPLPKKPVLQNITIADNNTNKEASDHDSSHEKKIKPAETKIEKKGPNRRLSLNKTTDKNTPVGTAELVKAAESKIEPSWMSMALKKQRSFKEDRPISEHRTVNKESEKQDKDRAEVQSKQQVDAIQNKTTSISVSVLPETYGQETKPERSEQRQRANTLPHPVHAAQLSLLTEKEEKALHKQHTLLVSQEPSWMELAKKKSQAWSDKPHIIK